MYDTKEIGCFNVSINDGNLDHDDNHWYYGLQIDRFDKETDEWKDSNFFYIQGHENGNFAEKTLKRNAVYEWLDSLTEEKVEKIYQNKRNHRFKIVAKATHLDNIDFGLGEKHMKKLLTLDEAIELYDKGHATLEGVYAACGTDLDFYNFLGGHLGLDEEGIKKKMHSVSGADDAFYNALSWMV